MSDALSVKMRPKYLPLSDREKQVLKLIAEGHNSKDAAKQLFISTKTVDAHRDNIKKKTGLRNAYELVVLAMEMGLVPIPTLKA